MMKKLTRKLVSTGLSLFLVLGSVSLSAPALASSSDLQASDVYSAKLLAKVSKHRVQVDSLLTQDSTTFVNPDGTFTTESSSAPIRVKDDSSPSGWRDLDFTLVVKPDGSVGPISGLFPLSLSNGGSADSVAVSGVVKAVGSDGTVIGFGWPDALPVPVLEGNRATYKNVLDGVDITVEATVDGFEQFFVLSKKPSVETLQQLAIPLQMRKVKLIPQSDGSFSFNSASNEPLANIPNPRVWDSSVDPMSGGSNEQTFDATYVSNVKTLQLDAVSTYFEDPNLVYPVTIDPAVVMIPNGDTYVQSDTGAGYGNTSELLVGTYNGGTTKARAFVRFNTSIWLRKQILSATLSMYEHWSYSCSARTVGIYPAIGNMLSGTSWATQPAIESTVYTNVKTALGYSGSCPSNWVQFPATNVVSYLAAHPNGGSNFSTIALRASETDSYGWKRFNSASGAHPPSLSVTYNTIPQTPSQVQIAPGQIVGGVQYATSLTPTLSTFVADGDKEKVNVSFNVYPDATSLVPSGTLCTVTAVVTGTSASCKPSVALSDNSTFYVRAVSHDLYIDSTASDVLILKTAGTAPNSPTVSCSGFANGSNTNTAPTSPINCSLTQTSTLGTSDAAKILLTLDSGDVQTIDVAQGALSQQFTLPAGAKGHVVQAVAYSAAGLASTETSYSFSIGDAGIYWPNQTVKTSGTAKLSAYVSPTLGVLTGARIDWATSDPTLYGSKAIPMATLQTFKTLQGLFDYRWNTRELFNTSGFTAYANGGVAPVNARICFTYFALPDKCSPYDISLLVVQHAFDATNPTIQAGAGTLALLTGELQSTATDATQSLPEGQLSISRTHLGFDGSLPANQDVFGPGWKASFAGIDSGVVNYTVADSTSQQGLLSLIDSDGNTLVFNTPNKLKTAQPTGTYLAAEQETLDTFASLKVDYSGTIKRLQFTEAEGRVTTWLYMNNTWQLQNVVEPNGQITNSYSYDSQGHAIRILGPVPSGVTCNLNTETAGCKALYVAYASYHPVAHPTETRYRVTSISYKAFDSSTNTMKSTVVANYTYDSSDYLVDVTDARSNQSTIYTYVSNALLQNKLIDSVKQDGFAAIHYSYSTTGELLNVTRDKADGSAGSDIEATFVYNTALSGTNLPDLSAANTASWGQNSDKTPKYAVAVFSANQSFTNTNLATQQDLSTLTADQLKTGSFYYTNSNGDTVNTASYGIDSWRYTYTERDNLARATKVFDENAISQILALKAAGDLDKTSIDQYATVNKYKDYVYATDGTQIDGGQLVESWTPNRPMNIGGVVVNRRLHTVINYDEGSPATKLLGGVAFGLETSRTTYISDSASSSEIAVAKTSQSYDPIDGASNLSNTSGWILLKPTKTSTLNPTTNAIVSQTQTLYDSYGRTVKTIGNGSDGTDSLTDYYTYYTVAANTTIPSCGSKPQFNGLLCFIGTQTGTNREKPSKKVTDYNYYLQPTSIIEAATNTSGSATRTTTLSYYPDNATAAAGKLNTTTITTSYTTGTIEPIQNIYDPTSGLLTKTQSTTNPTTQYVSYSYDLWGRKTSTTTKTATTLDTGSITYLGYGQTGAGQIGSTSTGQNTLIYSYGATDSNGNLETRNLPTGLSVSGIGTYSAEYNNAGQLTQNSAPGTVNQAFEYDLSGQLTRMSYNSDVTVSGITANMEWFDNTRNYDAFGRVSEETTPTGNPATDGDTTTYTYDLAGRLTQAAYVTDLSCTTRNYTFDAQGNRIAKTSQTTLAAASVCDSVIQSGTSRNLTFNKFSQITAAGYVYDALGRNTTLPAVDSPNGVLTTFDYGSDNRILKQTQGTKTFAYTFDALGRRTTEKTQTGTTVNSESTRHYSNESDNPAWVSSSTQTDIYTPSLGSALNAIKTVIGSTITKTVQVANIHGDTITIVTLPTTGAVTPPSQVNSFDEYGLQTYVANPDPQAAFQLNYGSLGQAQRETTDTGITLMGVRGYNPVTGQFLTPDPIPGGNETPYNYPNDPINRSDTSGKFDFWFGLGVDIAFSILGGLVAASICGPATVLCYMGVSAAIGFVLGTLEAAADGKDLTTSLVEGAKSAVFSAAFTGFGRSLGKVASHMLRKRSKFLSEEVEKKIVDSHGATWDNEGIVYSSSKRIKKQNVGGTMRGLSFR